MADSENTTKANKEQYITTEIVRTAYKQIPGIIAISILSGPITVYIFHPYAEESVTLTWLAIEYIICVFIPLALLYYYKKISPDDSELKPWAQIFVSLAVIGGSIWGSIGFIFFAEGNLIYQLILFFFLYTAVATAMAATAIFSAAFYALAFPMLLPIAVRAAMEGDGLHNIFSIITIIYLFSLIFFHRNIHNALIRSLTLQLENMDMAKTLETKNKEIELASNAKSRFLAAASHDLRQPLHAQTLFVAELQAKITDPNLLITIKHMKSSVDVMRDLFDALLDISRLDVGMIEPNLSSFDISHTFNKLKKEFLPQMQNKGLRFRTASNSHIIVSDKHLFERIIRNLLSNALAYTEEGSIMLCARKKKGQLHIEVRDSGIGIQKDLTESIFDEFSQLNNPERDRNKGLGLGLAIVKRLCTLLDHEINVKSTYKSGSIFTITAPLSEQTSVDAVIEEEPLATTRLKLNLSALVIDDNKTILAAMHGILTHWGCEVVCASSADQAQQLLSEQALIPDLIIADFRLCNNLTGIQAIQQICDSLSKDLPALLITGDTATKRLLEAKESEYDLLHKPIHPDKLYNWLYNNRPKTQH